MSCNLVATTGAPSCELFEFNETDEFPNHIAQRAQAFKYSGNTGLSAVSTLRTAQNFKKRFVWFEPWKAGLKNVNQTETPQIQGRLTLYVVVIGSPAQSQWARDVKWSAIDCSTIYVHWAQKARWGWSVDSFSEVNQQHITSRPQSPGFSKVRQNWNIHLPTTIWYPACYFAQTRSGIVTWSLDAFFWTVVRSVPMCSAWALPRPTKFVNSVFWNNMSSIQSWTWIVNPQFQYQQTCEQPFVNLNTTDPKHAALVISTFQR